MSPRWRRAPMGQPSPSRRAASSGFDTARENFGASSSATEPRTDRLRCGARTSPRRQDIRRSAPSAGRTRRRRSRRRGWSPCRTGRSADERGVVGEVHRDAVVEDVQRALPEPVVAVRLAVRRDAAVELVDLLEAAVLHQRGQHLAADAAGAVRDDRLVLEVVVGAAVERRDELARRLDRRAGPRRRSGRCRTRSGCGRRRTRRPCSRPARAARPGVRWVPPSTTPCSSTWSSSGAPNVTSSSRTRTLSRGKSAVVPSSRARPSLHLKSMSLNGAYAGCRGRTS